METPQSLTGGCVCRSLRFATTAEPLRITICHCLWCQRRTGSAFGVELVFNEEDVNFVGDTLRHHVHHSDESGRWLEQKYCSDCGSNMGLRLEAAPGIQSLPAGAFDSPKLLTDGSYPVRHVFTRSAQPWSLIPADVEQFEEHFRK